MVPNAIIMQGESAPKHPDRRRKLALVGSPLNDKRVSSGLRLTHKRSCEPCCRHVSFPLPLLTSLSHRLFQRSSDEVVAFFRSSKLELLHHDIVTAPFSSKSPIVVRLKTQHVDSLTRGHCHEHPLWRKRHHRPGHLQVLDHRGHQSHGLRGSHQTHHHGESRR